MKKLIFILFLLPAFIFGQGRKYSNEFLSIGIDARAMAMSGSVVGSTEDISSAYWNPAGLANIKDNWQAAAMHAEYFASIAQYDYFAFATPIDATSTVAVSFIRFGVDDIFDTTELIDQDGNVDYDRINKFTAADYALLLSYARSSEKIKGLNFGGNVKVIYRQIGEFADAVGFGFDLGIQYRSGKWSHGAQLRDATSTFNAWSINSDAFGPIFTQTKNELPTENLELTIPRLLIGSSRKFNLNKKYSLQAEFMTDITFDGQRNTLISSGFGNIDPALGLEVGYKKFVFLRAGVGNVQRLRNFDDSRYYAVQPNLGIGFKYRGISIDYALTDIGNSSGAIYSNIFSAKFNLGEFKN